MTNTQPTTSLAETVNRYLPESLRETALIAGIGLSVLGSYDAVGQPVTQQEAEPRSPVKELVQPRYASPPVVPPDSQETYSAEPVNLVRDNRPNGRRDYSIFLKGTHDDYVQAVPVTADAAQSYQALHMVKKEINDGDNEPIKVWEADHDPLAEDPEDLMGWYMTESGMLGFGFDKIQVEDYTYGR